MHWTAFPAATCAVAVALTPCDGRADDPHHVGRDGVGVGGTVAIGLTSQHVDPDAAQDTVRAREGQRRDDDVRVGRRLAPDRILVAKTLRGGSRFLGGGRVRHQRQRSGQRPGVRGVLRLPPRDEEDALVDDDRRESRGARLAQWRRE